MEKETCSSETEEVREIVQKERLSERDLCFLLSLRTKKARALLHSKADEVRKKSIGDTIHARALIEFSNTCRNNCLYCGIRCGNKNLPRYRMSPEEILSTAKKAASAGYGTVLLQSGEDLSYPARTLCSIISKIRKPGLVVSLSIGERPLEEYEQFYEAGAERVLIRFETSDPKLFKKFHPPSSPTKNNLSARLRLLSDLKRMGYFIGSGPLIGLPGQTPLHLARDLLLFNKLGIEMAGTGPFILHPHTPLADSDRFPVFSSLFPVSGTRHTASGMQQTTADRMRLAEKTIDAYSCIRLLCPDIFISATTALQTIDPFGRQKALRAGANLLMPNITPQKYRPLYSLYPNKACIRETADDCLTCVRMIVESLGRKWGTGPGHPPRRKPVSTSRF
ncbi:MAG: radical SAM protein [Candidatus Micrarchaeota archaeon]